MVKTYEELTDQEQTELAEAWTHVVKGLRIYQDKTGALGLQDVVYHAIWEAIDNYKKMEDNNV